MDICDICKKRPVKIHVEGEGDFCLDCYNKAFLEKIGVEDTYDYPRQMSVIEPGGKMHTFNIEHVILGTLVSWDAYEVGGEYHFRECSDIDENGTVVAQRFFKKIVKGVCTKSLKIRDYPAANLLNKDGVTYSIGDKGFIQISEDDSEGAPFFIIDGVKFTGEEFCQLFGACIGFDIHFQIHDASDPLPGENEYLVPVLITRETILEELQSYINIYGDKGFISYEQVSGFDTAFERIASKLEVLMQAGDRDKAVEIGKEVIKVLENIETDDDWFPNSDIEAVCRIVDPHRINPELWTDGEDYV